MTDEYVIHSLAEIDKIFKKIKDMLYVRVNVTITAEMNVNKTKTIKGVKADIRQDLDEYLWPVVRVFMSNLPLMTSLLSVPWIIFRYGQVYLRGVHTYS